MYSRDHGYHVGSSGFEHSFLTEIKYGSPIGLHNWIYYYMLENNHTSGHHVDYKGFMDILHLGVLQSFYFDYISNGVKSIRGKCHFHAVLENLNSREAIRNSNFSLVKRKKINLFNFVQF